MLCRQPDSRFTGPWGPCKKGSLERRFFLEREDRRKGAAITKDPRTRFRPENAIIVERFGEGGDYGPQ